MKGFRKTRILVMFRYLQGLLQNAHWGPSYDLLPRDSTLSLTNLQWLRWPSDSEEDEHSTASSIELYESSADLIVRIRKSNESYAGEGENLPVKDGSSPELDDIKLREMGYNPELGT